MAQPSPDQELATVRAASTAVLARFDEYAATKHPNSSQKDEVDNAMRGFKDAVSGAYDRLREAGNEGKPVDDLRVVVKETAEALEKRSSRLDGDGHELQVIGSNTWLETLGLSGSSASSRGLDLIKLGRAAHEAAESITKHGADLGPALLRAYKRDHPEPDMGALAKSANPHIPGMELKESSPRGVLLQGQKDGTNPNTVGGSAQTRDGPSEGGRH